MHGRRVADLPGCESEGSTAEKTVVFHLCQISDARPWYFRIRRALSIVDSDLSQIVKLGDCPKNRALAFSIPMFSRG